MAQKIPLSALAYLNLQSAGHGKFRSLKYAAEAIEPIWMLAYVRHKIDHWPTQSEYADYWEMSERSAQREWALFRRAFPSEESPERLARWLYSEVASRIEDRSVALSVTVPPDLVPA